MKPSIRKSLFITAAVAMSAGLLAPQAAQAQASGFYAGGSVGQAKGRDVCDEFAGIPCDDKDTAWKLFAGYQFTPNLGIEGGYVDFGTAKIGTGAAFADWEAKTWQLVAVGTMPLQNNFSVFAKAGFHRWDVDVNSNIAGVFGSDNGTDFTFGFGGGYEFTKNLGMRVEWERFNNVGEDNTTGKSDVDLISVGLRYRF